MRGFKPPKAMKPMAAPKMTPLALPGPMRPPVGADPRQGAKIAQDRARKSPPAIPKGLADAMPNVKASKSAADGKSEHANKPISGSQTAAHGKNKTAPVDTPY